MKAGLLIAALFACVFNVHAKVVTGSVDEDKIQWKFISKFCFDENGGVS